MDEFVAAGRPWDFGAKVSMNVNSWTFCPDHARINRGAEPPGADVAS